MWPPRLIVKKQAGSIHGSLSLRIRKRAKPEVTLFWR
jgi:hypothetical protein